MIELATLIEGETVDRWKEEGKVNIKKSVGNPEAGEDIE